MTLSQVVKVLDRIDFIKYSIIDKNRILLRDENGDKLGIYIISKDENLRVCVLGIHEYVYASSKFNSLTNDSENIYFSFKGQYPLTVKIK